MAEHKESIELTLPDSGKKVVLRGYTTGRISQELESIFLDQSEVINEDGKTKTVMNGAAIKRAHNRAIELLVVSVDGSTENILDAVLDLSTEDHDYVYTKLDEVEGHGSPKK
ncbi:UNVERIFIED_ORG: hypothetical protein ABID57_000712 [Arthrobacter sp. UYEF1]